MACLIVRKREASPISSAHVRAVIGPTPGMVLSRLSLSASKRSRSRELIRAYSIFPRLCDRLPAELEQGPNAFVDLFIGREQLTEVAHLMEPLLVVTHAGFHQQTRNPVL